MTGDPMSLDAVIAAADLAERGGALGIDIGYDDADPVTWHVTALYRGRSLHVTGYPDAESAANALAKRLLTGGVCRCGRKVTLREGMPGQCPWQLRGRRWEPGCDAVPIPMKGSARGDLAAMNRAIAERKRADRQEKGQ